VSLVLAIHRYAVAASAANPFRLLSALLTTLTYRFEEQIGAGKLSRDSKPDTGGLEAVAGGGMHTLAVDEGGRVRRHIIGQS